MDSSSLPWLAALGAATATIIAGWSTVQQSLGWLASIVIDRVELDSEYVVQHYTVYKARWCFPESRRYEVTTVLSDGEARSAVLSAHSSPTLARTKHGFVVAFGHRMWFIRGTLRADKLAEEAQEAWELRVRQGSNSRFCISVLRGSGSYMRQVQQHTSTGSPVSGDIEPDRKISVTWPRSRRMVSDFPDSALFDTPPNTGRTYVEPESAKAFRGQVEIWLKSKAWYAEREIPWRRGFLLSGEPGTGKTSLVMQVARNLNLPVFMFDLASMTNNEFSEHWKRVGLSAPAIVLFEDIDAVFEGRKNVAGEAGGGLTFDCLINTLSGSHDVSGVILVATANNPDVLDPALTRPGRLDCSYRISGLTKEQIKELAGKILDDPSDVQKAVDTLEAGITGARAKEFCVNLALQRKLALERT